MKNEKIIMKHDGVEGLETFEKYRFLGGYDGLEKALDLKPEEIVEIVKRADLRGRGGAGFPTGVKWGFVPRNSGKPVYLCVNADESEPGTFKDRWIIWKNPHLLLEGTLIASYALGCELAFIYIRGEFKEGADILERAIEELREKRLIGKNILGKGVNIDIIVHRGAGAYICGEETGLIESLEGKRGMPRNKPPFPAIEGLYGCPTVVNNVETLANLPFIINNGPEAFVEIGVPKNGGTKQFCLCGHFANRGIFELPLGTNLKEIVENYGGGARDGKKIKGVIVGGSSFPVMLPEELDVPADFDSLMKVGSFLGSGSLILLDEDTDVVDACLNISRFYAHESCGQCTPCREGTVWLRKILQRIKNGGGEPDDLDVILEICSNIKGATICALGDAAAMPVESFVTKFRDEFEERIRSKGKVYAGTH